MNSSSDQRLSGGDMSRRTDMEQFVEFEVHGQRYAFPIQRIREIVILKNVTPMPQVAAYVDGVSNLRGTIIPIINLRVLFGMERVQPDDETRTIVVHVGDKTMGCTVDTVTQVLRVERDSIGSAPETITTDGGGYIRGFIRFAERLVIILDVDELLRIEQLANVQHAGIAQMARSITANAPDSTI